MASTFASNFVVADAALKHERGEDTLTRWAQSKTIASGSTMENSFCPTCGTLMYRRSTKYPGASILRLGTLDDVSLMEGKMKPTVEQYVQNRVSWLKGADGVEQHMGAVY
ncbi:hypothetical protein LTR08_006427 [Meristemomyces frigidus]|nr:hypothetical protein LTR08_006427 [Meristemomyces frigidus]